MHLVLALLPLAILLIWVRICMRNASAISGIRELPASAPVESLPTLSVIVAARNEADAITDCVTRLQAQSFPNLEIIAVNDRSTDSTGRLIDEAAQKARETPGLHPVIPVHLSEADLPAGWLGKCNALSHGAKAARGEWLLFLDGDILLDECVVSRALTFARERQADMVSVLPTMLPGSRLEQSLMLVFSSMFLYKFHPTHAMDPSRPEYIGVGAFNMVRREAYDSIGGHERLRLMIIDDVGLGAFIKRAGFQLAVAGGSNLVRVRWYPSVGAMIRGLEKNAFAGIDYSIAKLVGASIAVGMLYLGPVLLSFLSPWPWNVVAVANLALFAFMGYVASKRQSFGGIRVGLLMPVGAILFIATMVRSAYITLRQGGVRWRDSFYPLSELREFILPR